MIEAKRKSVNRILLIDIARLYGIALVYYGHFIESYMKEGSMVAAMQYKFIYSFHMPLFFILSGYIAKQSFTAQGFAVFAKRQLLSRLLPYAFLSLILVIPTFWLNSFSVGLELPSVNGYVKGLAATFLAGFPYFNIPTWFLICLFMVELMHYFTARYLGSHSRIIAIAIGFYLVGSILAWHAGILNPLNLISPDGKIYPYFMILEAFTGYSLYLVGFYLRQINFLAAACMAPRYILATLACLALVYFTFDLNKGMFTIPSFDAVVMLASSHGNPILFPVTAIIGSVLIMLLAGLTGNQRILGYLGSNALVIFGLNGVFYHFINDRLAATLLTWLPEEPMMIFASGVLVTTVSISLTIPFVFLFNTLIPQLMGKPGINGPLIPRLVR